ncbi:MAG: hypothetical protein KME54_17405 [Tolypothrix brevis GSE-NOS-MK-07-07A]|nr:hypothetical protein [Tolypothrix brevis GSE-NOS-MK-07-07A]
MRSRYVTSDTTARSHCKDVAVLRLYKGLGQRIVQFGRCLIEISRKQCKDVAVLRLYKGLGQRIVQFGRCVIEMRSLLARFPLLPIPKLQR